MKPNDSAPVVVFGELGCGNLGNDGSLEVVLEAIEARQPGVPIRVVGYGVEVIRQRYAVPAVTMNAALPSGAPEALRLPLRAALRVVDFGRTWAQVRGARAVVIAGAGVFEGELGTRPTGLPLAFWRLAAACRLAHVPLVVLAVGASPVAQRWSRTLFAAGLRLAAYRSFRDRRSAEVVASWLGGPPDRVSADVALLRTDVTAVGREPAPTTGTTAVGLMAAGGLRDAAAAARYRAAMIETVRGLLGDGRRVLLTVGDAVDVELLDDVAAAFAADDRVTRTVPSTLGEVVHAFSTVDAVIAARYHNVLVAIALGKPTVAVSYARKTVDLMERVGLGDLCIGSADVTSTTALTMLRAAQRGPRRPDSIALGAMVEVAKRDLAAGLAIMGVTDDGAGDGRDPGGQRPALHRRGT